MSYDMRTMHIQFRSTHITSDIMTAQDLFTINLDIIEGDIKLDEETAKLLKFLMTPKSKVQKAAARNKYARRWDNLLNAIGMYEIPYKIHDSISKRI